MHRQRCQAPGNSGAAAGTHQPCADRPRPKSRKGVVSAAEASTTRKAKASIWRLTCPVGEQGNRRGCTGLACWFAGLGWRQGWVATSGLDVSFFPQMHALCPRPTFLNKKKSRLSAESSSSGGRKAAKKSAGGSMPSQIEKALPSLKRG